MKNPQLSWEMGSERLKIKRAAQGAGNTLCGSNHNPSFHRKAQIMARAVPIPPGFKIQDLSGRLIGRLRVAWYAGRNGSGHHHWICLCQCGNVVVRAHFNLLRKVIKDQSCGCTRQEPSSHGNFTHGGRQRPEYVTWCGMKQRCSNPNRIGYADYGGRGITVCERWRESFEDFYVDMGPRPSTKHSLHRIDNDGNYEPGNVVWADRKTQANARRSSRLLTFNGETKTISQWSESIGVEAYVISLRLQYGWSVDDALTMPLGEGPTKKPMFLEYMGERKQLAEWARKTGISRTAIMLRIRRGWTVEQALTLPVGPGLPIPRMLTHNGITQSILGWSKTTGIRDVTIRARLKMGWPIEDTLTKPVRPHAKASGT